MLTKSNGSSKHAKAGKTAAPCLKITKLGIVSRDYGQTFKNGCRDFSYVLSDILKMLDDKGCDAVLLSLFSIVPRKSYDLCSGFNGFLNIKAVCLEEFQDGENRKAGRYVIHHLTPAGWKEYDFNQQFGTMNGMAQRDIHNFVHLEMPRRILGNCCVLLCGETNGVKYSPKDKEVKDTFGIRSAIPKEVTIVLNPIHDRMTRFEMMLKRIFLSENNRWVVSVWNKGKKDKRGVTRDGRGPAWTVFHNGNKINVDRLPNEFGVEIGVLDFKKE